MEPDEIHDVILNFRENVFGNLVEQYIPAGSIDEQWDVEAVEARRRREAPMQFRHEEAPDLAGGE